MSEINLDHDDDDDDRPMTDVGRFYTKQRGFRRKPCTF